MSDRAIAAGKSLVRRVGIASAAAAALAGALAAGTVGLASERGVRARDEGLTRRAAEVLFTELTEEDDDDEPEGWPERLTDELDELDLPGARASFTLEGVRVAGDALPAAPPGGCVERELDGALARLCTVTRDGVTLTLATSAEEARAERGIFVIATLAGFFVGGLLGAIAGMLAARWALAPLVAIGARVRRVDPNRPDPEVLAPPSAYREIEALREAIAELVARLGALLAHARRFAFEAAHELRTPLTTVRGELELFEESPDPEGLARARAQVDALSALVERLLVLAAPIESAHAREAVDLEDVVGDVLAALDAESRDRVEVRMDRDVLVRGDATLLGVLVGNAIQNALKFSSGPVRVSVRAEEAGALMEVEDEGPGIPPEERVDVMRPFYRSRAARAGSTGGHGLGLALIAQVAEAHGGRVELPDTARGTRLRVILPRWTSA